MFSNGDMSQVFGTLCFSSWPFSKQSDNAITFKLKSILLFWYSDNLLEKDKTGLLFQTNNA